MHEPAHLFQGPIYSIIDSDYRVLDCLPNPFRKGYEDDGKGVKDIFESDGLEASDDSGDECMEKGCDILQEL